MDFISRKFFQVTALMLLAIAGALVILSMRAQTAADKWIFEHVVPGKISGVTYVTFTRREAAIENSWDSDFGGTTADQSTWQDQAAGWRITHVRTQQEESGGSVFYRLWTDGVMEWLGFAWTRNETKFADASGKMVGVETYRGLIVPLWALLTATLLPSMIVALRLLIGGRITRRRRRLGLCIACGYDLRASKDRCPECGRGMEATEAV